MTDWLPPNSPRIATMLMIAEKNMKQKLLIILTFTVINLDLNSQINYCEAYYPPVNKAELNIVLAEYSEALQTYGIAFKTDYND